MCDRIHHNLKTIYTADVGWNEDHVVKWCVECGVVVVDLESDNRIFRRLLKTNIPKDLKSEMKPQS
jgi:uncharacterized radical SAM superfamily protein